ncbi:unnamed protein product, partial [Rotaria sp. Silwood1]
MAYNSYTGDGGYGDSYDTNTYGYADSSGYNADATYGHAGYDTNTYGYADSSGYNADGSYGDSYGD